jgi:hypothetical protein
MTTPQMQSREEVVAEMRATGKYAEPVAGEPTLGYLGDLGHRYARPDQLTKEALFGRGPAEPLVQTPEMKQRAESHERQQAIAAKFSGVAGLATRFMDMLRPNSENKASKTFRP